ncbi:MAG: hypothetical protein Ct9H300mP21_02050 [Pseudomonadota bacterium]|nr:MAG: hypothetical protein Ct9H300mP21_02050 [Pseudomonadota bacterium]
MLGMVVSADPCKTGFTEFMDANSSNPFIKGVRQVLHNPEIPPKYCLTPEFVQGIRDWEEGSTLRHLHTSCGTT